MRQERSLRLQDRQEPRSHRRSRTYLASSLLAQQPATDIDTDRTQRYVVAERNGPTLLGHPCVAARMPQFMGWLGRPV
jgi:hypothetical protein